MEMKSGFEKVIADDLFDRIRSENIFLLELQTQSKDPNFSLSDQNSIKLEEIRAKYQPEMKKLYDLGRLDEYNKIADLLILPPIFKI